MTKEKRRQRLKEHEEESAPHRAACAAMARRANLCRSFHQLIPT